MKYIFLFINYLLVQHDNTGFKKSHPKAKFIKNQNIATNVIELEEANFKLEEEKKEANGKRWSEDSRSNNFVLQRG